MLIKLLYPSPTMCPDPALAASCVSAVRSLVHSWPPTSSPLTAYQHGAPSIVRDDRLQPCAAVDHVFHPVGRGDGVVPSPPKMRSGAPPRPALNWAFMLSVPSSP
jgi:hypothetical protein